MLAEPERWVRVFGFRASLSSARIRALKACQATGAGPDQEWRLLKRRKPRACVVLLENGASEVVSHNVARPASMQMPRAGYAGRVLVRSQVGRPWTDALCAHSRRHRKVAITSHNHAYQNCAATVLHV